MALLRHVLAAISIIGTALFGTVLLVASLFPLQVERIAKHLVRAEVESRVRDKLHSIGADSLAARTTAIGERLARESNAARSLIDSELPKIIERELAKMQDPACECRKGTAAGVTSLLKFHLTGLEAMRERLADAVRANYQTIAAKLLRELRIFSAANMLCFALLGVALWVRKAANVHVLPAALVLLLAAGLTAGLYLFAQDWMRTILFDSYVGFAYFAYVGIVFALLSDVIFNRARVIVGIFNGVSNVSLSPC
jgi:hypothetical protein